MSGVPEKAEPERGRSSNRVVDVGDLRVKYSPGERKCSKSRSHAAHASASIWFPRRTSTTLRPHAPCADLPSSVPHDQTRRRSLQARSRPGIIPGWTAADIEREGRSVFTQQCSGMAPLSYCGFLSHRQAGALISPAPRLSKSPGSHSHRKTNSLLFLASGSLRLFLQKAVRNPTERRQKVLQTGCPCDANPCMTGLRFDIRIDTKVGFPAHENRSMCICGTPIAVLPLATATGLPEGAKRTGPQ